jgi:hypothetical protein
MRLQDPVGDIFEFSGELLLLLGQLRRLFGNFLRQRFFALPQTRHFGRRGFRLGRGDIPLAFEHTGAVALLLHLPFETLHTLA